jgi:hypothetical protein
MAVTSGAGRLKSGRLGAWDLTVSTGARIGPGISIAIGAVLLVQLAYATITGGRVAGSSSQAGNA